MKKIHFISMPLLSKELLEQANRKRTYVLRVVFAVLMSAVFLIALANSTSSGSRIDFWQLKNIGESLSGAILGCQFIAVIVILPASMASVITLEKERNSLELILLTRLKPWEIVLQKYLSRIIPVVMFIFLTFPLMAVAYAMGGLTSNTTPMGYIFAELIMLIFFIGAVGILFSSYFRSSVTSIVMTYITTGYVIFLFFMTADIWRFTSNMPTYLTVWMFLQFLFIIFAIPLSVLFLYTRRNLRKGNPLMRIFNSLDQFWKEMNVVTGGIEIIKSDNYRLPGENPVAWYEKYKRPTGKAHYLARIIVFATLPVIFLFLLSISGFRVMRGGGEIIMIIFFSLSVIILIAKSASVVAEERQNQTLGVLLTTEISAKEIILEKMRAISRLHLATGIPIALLAGLIVWYGGINSYGYYYRNQSEHFYWKYSIMILIYFFIYLKFILWTSCYIGMKLKTHRRAVTAAFLAFILWIVLPFIPMIMWMVTVGIFHSNDFLDWIAYLSPAAAFGKMTGDGKLPMDYFISASIVILVAYIVIRVFTLRQADQYLRK